MRHILYKTTNLENGRYYIGIHSTKDENFSKIGSKDGYLGSGKILGLAIKHYGRENFKIEILKEFSSKKETLLAEAELVTEEFLKNNPKCYNVVPGGGLPPNYEHTIWYTNGNHDIRIKDGEIIPEGYKKGRKKCVFSEEFLESRRIYIIERNKTLGNPSQDKSICDKISKTRKRKYAAGEIKPTKSMEGKWWCNNGENNRICEAGKLPAGYDRGKTGFSYIWITNGKDNKMIEQLEIIPNGWYIGRSMKDFVGSVWVTNGKENRRMKKNETPPDGFYFGMIKTNRE